MTPLRCHGWIAALLLAGSAGLRADTALTWSRRVSGTQKDLRSVAYGQGRYLAVGHDWDGPVMLRSADGAAWSAAAAPVTAGDMVNLAFAQGRFLLRTQSQTWYSADGVVWTDCTPDRQPHWIRAAGGEFWGLNGNVISRSPDGLAWTVLLDPPDPRAVFRDIACGNGVTVAVGSDREGRIALTRSADQGIHWAAVGPALENTLQSVTYGNGLFVAVGGTGGQHGLIMTSPDGLAWTVRSDTYAYRLNHVRYAQGLFAIVGDAGTVLLSSDGIQWTRQWADGGAPVTGQPLYAVCEAQGRFLAVGRKGAIVQSDPVPMLPEPLIVVNGARGALTVGRSDPVTVAIALNAGSYAGVLPVDYIVLAVAEGGPWFYLDAARRWIPLGSRDPADCRPVHSGLLMDLPVPIVVLQARSLAPGVYDCYFVLDYPMNGLFDGIPRQYRYDRVRVVVQ